MARVCTKNILREQNKEEEEEEEEERKSTTIKDVNDILNKKAKVTEYII